MTGQLLLVGVSGCPDDTDHDPNGPDDSDCGPRRFGPWVQTIRTAGMDDTDRGYGPVRYTPIYTPRYDNSYWHCVVFIKKRIHFSITRARLQGAPTAHLRSEDWTSSH